MWINGDPFSYYNDHFWKERDFNPSDTIKHVQIMNFVKELIRMGKINPRDRIEYIYEQWMASG